MDLLGRSHLWFSFRRAALQTHKIARIRERESGSGVRAWSWEVGKISGKWKWEWAWWRFVTG